jgi:predicted small metal-binding protein
MAKTYACADLGEDCGWSTSGETENEVMANIVEHAAEVHPDDEWTPEVTAEVRGAIKDA